MYLKKVSETMNSRLTFGLLLVFTPMLALSKAIWESIAVNTVNGTVSFVYHNGISYIADVN